MNAAAFGSGLALRSPHLWLLQRQLQVASLALLKKPEYAAIATASHLSSRPRPVWSKVCVLLQTLEVKSWIGVCLRCLLAGRPLWSYLMALGSNSLRVPHHLL